MKCSQAVDDHPAGRYNTIMLVQTAFFKSGWMALTTEGDLVLSEMDCCVSLNSRPSNFCNVLGVLGVSHFLLTFIITSSVLTLIHSSYMICRSVANLPLPAQRAADSVAVQIAL